MKEYSCLALGNVLAHWWNQKIACPYHAVVPPMRFDWAPVVLGWGSLGGTAALLGSAFSSVGRRSRITPLSSEGAGWCAALVTKACAQHATGRPGGS